MDTFGARVVAARATRGSLCVGIDPHPGLLEAWGLPASAAGLERFAATCVESFCDLAAVVKPQSAFFERFGSAGVAVLEQTIAGARAAGALVIVDAKRGDIGSTMTAYADTYCDPSSPLAGDAVTLSPYLGLGSLEPAFEACAAGGTGAFVLALTSNKEGPQFQHARVDDGRLVAQVVVDELAARNRGDEPLGSLGIVMGATVGESVVDLGALNAPILSPGVGAQGGTAEDVRRVFGAASRDVLPSASREVLRLGPDPAAMRAGVERLVDQFAFLQNP